VIGKSGDRVAVVAHDKELSNEEMGKLTELLGGVDNSESWYEINEGR
jgi:hypothetical protein